MNDVSTLRQAIAKAEKQLESSDVVLKLTKNPEFQEVVLRGYFNEGMEQLLNERVDPYKQSDEALAFNTRKIDAIAVFKGWLTNQLQAGMEAEAALVELRAELDTALTEAVGEV